MLIVLIPAKLLLVKACRFGEESSYSGYGDSHQHIQAPSLANFTLGVFLNIFHIYNVRPVSAVSPSSVTDN